MKQNKIFSTFLIAMALCITSFKGVQAQYFTQDFDNIQQVLDWININNSLPLGPDTWHQGNVSVFFPQSGPGYIAVNYNSTTDPGNNAQISNWLIGPAVFFHNGDILTFYTRKADSVTVNYADRMQVRLSLAGQSYDVGQTDNSVGDFTNLLLDINPTLSHYDYPVGYPYEWTRFDLVISGLTGPTEGRFAFRYFVQFAGATGNADYIGLDSVALHPGTVGMEEAKEPMQFSVYPNPVSNALFVDCNASVEVLKIIDLLGNEVAILQPVAGRLEYNTSSLKNGIYYVVAQSGNGIITRKISVIR